MTDFPWPPFMPENIAFASQRMDNNSKAWPVFYDISTDTIRECTQADINMLVEIGRAYAALRKGFREESERLERLRKQMRDGNG